jgi:predicted RNA-binding protein with PUA-like domain
MARRYWLMKSDPDTFGLAHLAKSPDQTTCWDGVRNYQARNLLRDEVRVGDRVLFYHSQVQPPAVVAVARVTRGGYADPTQFDRRSRYHDPKSDRADPRWYAVDIRLERELERAVTLPEMRAQAGLGEMVLLRKGSRLSVQPVTRGEWGIVMKLAKRAPGKSRGRK